MMRIACIIGLLAVAIHAQAQEGVTQVGTIRHTGLSESSGLTLSHRYAGVFWTHNDEQQISGRHFLFAMRKSGKVLGAFEVHQNLIDWEDIAADKKGNLYLADIGSNGLARTHVAVHRVREPDPYKRFGAVIPEQTWLLRFPDAVKPDCEAFFLHGKYGYIISKYRDRVTDLVNLYRFSLSDTRRSIPLEQVSQILTEYNVTAASLSPDKQRLALVTSHGVGLYFVNGDPTTAASPGWFVPVANADSMEGGTFFGTNFITCAETRQVWELTDSKFACQDRPRFLGVPLENRREDAGTTIDFEAFPDGCPSPQLFWRFNGQIIPGATNSLLRVPSVTPADAGLYEAVAVNRYGTATNSATLTVIVRTGPDVRITEVMSSRASSVNLQTEDWWELTNFEDVPIDLYHWRFNDAEGGFSDAYMITNHVVVQPAETIVLVENLRADAFRAWWGPINAQIVTYGGDGYSFDAGGDEINLWTDTEEVVAHHVLGRADPGVSLIYNPITEVFGEKAQLGVHSVRKAAATADIGSPGDWF